MRDARASVDLHRKGKVRWGPLCRASRSAFRPRTVRGAAPVSLGSIALKYKYQSLQPEGCAISHNNLSNYLERAGEPRERWLAHRLGAALIYIQTGSGGLQTTLRNFAHSDLPPAPPTFDEVAAEVDKIEGTRFRELFNRLPKPFTDGDAALAAIWQRIPGAKGELARQRVELEQQKAKRQAVLAELPPPVRQAFDLGGKEFSDALKAAIDALPPDQRETMFKQLREAGIIGAGPAAGLSFCGAITWALPAGYSP